MSKDISPIKKDIRFKKQILKNLNYYKIEFRFVNYIEHFSELILKIINVIQNKYLYDETLIGDFSKLIESVGKSFIKKGKKSIEDLLGLKKFKIEIRSSKEIRFNIKKSFTEEYLAEWDNEKQQFIQKARTKNVYVPLLDRDLIKKYRQSVLILFSKMRQLLFNDIDLMKDEFKPFLIYSKMIDIVLVKPRTIEKMFNEDPTSLLHLIRLLIKDIHFFVLNGVSKVVKDLKKVHKKMFGYIQTPRYYISFDAFFHDHYYSENQITDKKMKDLDALKEASQKFLDEFKNTYEKVIDSRILERIVVVKKKTKESSKNRSEKIKKSFENILGKKVGGDEFFRYEQMIRAYNRMSYFNFIIDALRKTFQKMLGIQKSKQFQSSQNSSTKTNQNFSKLSKLLKPFTSPTPTLKNLLKKYKDIHITDVKGYIRDHLGTDLEKERFYWEFRQGLKFVLSQVEFGQRLYNEVLPVLLEFTKPMLLMQKWKGPTLNVLLERILLIHAEMDSVGNQSYLYDILSFLISENNLQLAQIFMEKFKVKFTKPQSVLLYRTAVKNNNLEMIRLLKTKPKQIPMDFKDIHSWLSVDLYSINKKKFLTIFKEFTQDKTLYTIEELKTLIQMYEDPYFLFKYVMEEQADKIKFEKESQEHNELLLLVVQEHGYSDKLVDLFLKDKRFDPSYKNGEVFQIAINKKHYNTMLKLLEDERLNPGARDIFLTDLVSLLDKERSFLNRNKIVHIILKMLKDERVVVSDQNIELLIAWAIKKKSIRLKTALIEKISNGTFVNKEEQLRKLKKLRKIIKTTKEKFRKIIYSSEKNKETYGRIVLPLFFEDTEFQQVQELKSAIEELDNEKVQLFLNKTKWTARQYIDIVKIAKMKLMSIFASEKEEPRKNIINIMNNILIYYLNDLIFSESKKKFIDEIPNLWNQVKYPFNLQWSLILSIMTYYRDDIVPQTLTKKSVTRYSEQILKEFFKDFAEGVPLKISQLFLNSLTHKNIQSEKGVILLLKLGAGNMEFYTSSIRLLKARDYSKLLRIIIPLLRNVENVTSRISALFTFSVFMERFKLIFELLDYGSYPEIDPKTSDITKLVNQFKDLLILSKRKEDYKKYKKIFKLMLKHPKVLDKDKKTIRETIKETIETVMNKKQKKKWGHDMKGNFLQTRMRTIPKKLKKLKDLKELKESDRLNKLNKLAEFTEYIKNADLKKVDKFLNMFILSLEDAQFFYKLASALEESEKNEKQKEIRFSIKELILLHIDDIKSKELMKKDDEFMKEVSEVFKAQNNENDKYIQIGMLSSVDKSANEKFEIQMNSKAISDRNYLAYSRGVEIKQVISNAIYDNRWDILLYMIENQIFPYELYPNALNLASSWAKWVIYRNLRRFWVLHPYYRRYHRRYYPYLNFISPLYASRYHRSYRYGPLFYKKAGVKKRTLPHMVRGVKRPRIPKRTITPKRSKSPKRRQSPKRKKS